jgi:hypothetical protein
MFVLTDAVQYRAGLRYGRRAGNEAAHRLPRRPSKPTEPFIKVIGKPVRGSAGRTCAKALAASGAFAAASHRTVAVAVRGELQRVEWTAPK